jgi:hypothetical protein
MSARLPTHLLIGAMLRRVNDTGGFGVVRARGDTEAGVVLVLADGRAWERGFDGALVETRGAEAAEPLDDYWRRRRARDPDLWVIELEGAGTADALTLLGGVGSEP